MKTSKLTLVCDIYELTNKDEKNIQKLARKIEEGEGVAEKFKNGIFKKSSYNASTTLLAKIAYKYQGREETLSLLQYAISHKNNQAVKDLLEEAKKQKLLKKVLNEEMTTKHSDGREENHTILTDAISRRDNDMIRAVLKISEENGILKEIVKKRITIKHSNGKEMTYTPFTYAEVCENSEAVRELGNILNKRATQQSTVVTAKTTTAKDGTTALHIAAEDCNFDMVKCLVINGANINARDKNDNTPLYLATQDREYQDKDIKEDVKEYLINRGAHI
ncbi:ankyrin repeat domain-containing protein [Wolbachia endosymbiont (group A) of Lasioglossum morio]|uniref:ankyrin repeat domain-containing protein n=1 Tax=Wolbachia endosymbiont (group A) of Lasioglossum morio TaxID=2954025 RepID=UPI00222607B7|nr:ankyrin repeat domain-containing protein [Wolbachia endosymbiont (group A) of Lasioglossum morio]